jgi:hypothetical protein
MIERSLPRPARHFSEASADDPPSLERATEDLAGARLNLVRSGLPRGRSTEALAKVDDRAGRARGSRAALQRTCLLSYPRKRVSKVSGKAGSPPSRGRPLRGRLRVSRAPRTRSGSRLAAPLCCTDVFRPSHFAPPADGRKLRDGLEGALHAHGGMGLGRTFAATATRPRTHPCCHPEGALTTEGSGSKAPLLCHTRESGYPAGLGNAGSPPSRGPYY